MNVQKIEVTRSKARELYRKYKQHQHYSEPIDHEIQRTYQLIAQGRVVIRAVQSVISAGLGEDGWPRLALANATHQSVTCHMEKDGRTVFHKGGWGGERDRRNTFRVAAGVFVRQVPMKDWRETASAMVPLVPIHLRPKRGLQNYHILFEAIWKRVPPRDPMLLRRIGGDLWLVVAAWDLTEVERAAMASRVSSS